MPRNRSLQGETLLQSLAFAVGLAVVCRAVAFGRGVYLARVLTPEQIGSWALIANAIQVLAFVCVLGIPNGLSRYADRHRGGPTLGRFFRGAWLRALSVAALLCGLGAVFWEPAGKLLFGESGSRPVVWITMAAVFATALLMTAQGMLRGLRLFREDSLFDLAQHLTFLAAAVLLLGVWRNDAYAAAWANLTATLVVGFAIGWWIRRCVHRAGGLSASGRNGPAPGAMRWRFVLAYSLGAWTAGSLQALWRVIDRYMLLHLGGMGVSETLDQIGQYYIASKLGQPLSALCGILSMALLPHTARIWDRQGREEVAEMVSLTTKLAALAMAFAGAVLIVYKPVLIQLVTGRAATLAVAVFSPVLVTVIAVSLHFILRTYLMCDERAWTVSGVWLITLLANAGLNAVLIPRFGLPGAVWATMVSSVLALGLVVVFSAWRGMRVDFRLITALLMPGLLLLPRDGMLLSLSAVAAAVMFTEGFLSTEEKRRINQACADRLKTYLVGPVARRVAPRPSSS